MARRADNGNNFGRSAIVYAMALAAALAATAEAQDGDAEATDATRVVEPCLNHPNIRRTKILNDRNIVFVLRGGQIYNNQLPRQCPGLRRGGLVNYGVDQGRLCAGNAFQVIMEMGPGNFVPAFVCQLGHFLPITEGEFEDLTAMTAEDRSRRGRGRNSSEAVTTEPVELPSAETAPTE